MGEYSEKRFMCNELLCAYNQHPWNYLAGSLKNKHSFKICGCSEVPDKHD